MASQCDNIVYQFLQSWLDKSHQTSKHLLCKHCVSDTLSCCDIDKHVTFGGLADMQHFLETFMQLIYHTSNTHFPLSHSIWFSLWIILHSNL